MGKHALTPDEVTSLTSMLPGLTNTSGLTYDGETLTVPELLDKAVDSIMAGKGWKSAGSRNALRAYAANKALALHNGGTTFKGGALPTDVESEARLAHARSHPAGSPMAHALRDGVVVRSDDVGEAHTAVMKHWDAVAMALHHVVSGIEDGNIKSTKQIDAAKWPSNGTEK